MASWCWICHRKVSYDYRYYKGDKAHPKCIKRHKDANNTTEQTTTQQISKDICKGSQASQAAPTITTPTTPTIEA